MGKAAENEKRKLYATRLNNLGVGALIAGWFVPYFAIVPRGFEFNVSQILETGLTQSQLQVGFASLLSVIIAFGLATFFWRRAAAALEHVED